MINSKKTLSGGLVLSALVLTGCTEAPSTLQPQGPGAGQISTLWWLMFWLATAVFIIVVGLLFYALFRPRQSQPERDAPRSKRDNILIAGGGVVTLIILLVVYFFTLRTMSVLAATDASDEYSVQVIGRQWWWEVRYRDQTVITANEIHIPVGQPIALQVESADVIHSFWVPELHGKMDMIPGQTNTFWLQADQPGEYYGVCAEFCGIQHAKMAFIVVAEPLDEFTTWLDRQSQPAPEPVDALAQQGQQVFLDQNCAQCHTIRGTNASGTLGPELTHFGSRRTLAAGILPNNRENLTRWIVEPHEIKPGNLMPATDLSDSDLQALLAYLEGLE